MYSVHQYTAKLQLANIQQWTRYDELLLTIRISRKINVPMLCLLNDIYLSNFYCISKDYLKFVISFKLLPPEWFNTRVYSTGLPYTICNTNYKIIVSYITSQRQLDIQFSRLARQHGYGDRWWVDDFYSRR